MPAMLETEGRFRVTVTAAPPGAQLAVDCVLGSRGIAARLERLPAVLTGGLQLEEARRARLLLSLFGLTVRLEPEGADAPPVPEDPAVDLSVQLSEGADRAAGLARLAEVLGEDADALTLDRPGGLVVPGLDAQDRRRIARLLKRDPGLRVTLSSRETAVLDLFAPDRPAVRAEVRRLGLGPCHFSAAMAGGVNLATGLALLRRIGPEALLVDRAFQRFDLRLRSAPGVAPADLSAFLDTRPGADHRALRRGCEGGEVRVEADLSRAAAERFVVDYSEIGLEVVPVLRGCWPENR